MTSTTEIASQVVEEFVKANVSCDKKGRRTLNERCNRSLDRIMVKEMHCFGRYGSRN
jgi:hypothetical protein